MNFKAKPKKVNIPNEPEKAYIKALQTAYNILGYKDNTEGELKDKLSQRGYSEETICDVILTVKSKGFLSEDRMMIRLVRSLAETRLLGKMRIVQEVRHKGFSRCTLEGLDFNREELCDIDFENICYRLLKKKGGEKDRKTYALLVRYGHSSQDIRLAYKRLSQEQNEAYPGGKDFG